jgi:hypothetical protein
MSHYYQIYGLKIKSSRAIDLLPEQPGCIADLDVKWITDGVEAPNSSLNWQPVNTQQLQKRERIAFFRSDGVDKGYFKICYDTILGKIIVMIDPAKTNIWILHNTETSYSYLNSLFVGSILGCILRLKGILCFHGSVVNIEGRAVVLTGKKHSGKSTTAKAFAQLGFKVLSDDIAAVNIINGSFYVQPGYPKVRLRPKPLEFFYPDEHHNFVLAYSHRDSKYSDLNQSFWGTPLPLGAIYILGRALETDGPPCVSPISAERIIHLHSNTFAGYVITSDLLKEEFKILGRIASKIPVRYLNFGRDVNLVYQQCETILNDLERLKVSKTEL